MLLQSLLVLTLVIFALGEYKCSVSDCHECIEDTCHLTCQGEDCSSCPKGDCCDGENCNVCIASICCSTPKCNECVEKRRSSCYKGATDSVCDDLVAEKCGLKGNKELFGGNYINGLHNVTTIIRLKNVINNTNFVDAPILLNITNVKNVSVSRPTPRTAEREGSYRRHNGCCSIVHPQECYTLTGVPNKVCFTRRHTECSFLCGNSTNLLIKNSNSGSSKCIIVAVHPYYYCGYYTTEDCSACYNCKNKSKLECLEDSFCSNTCRLSVLPRRYYNVPYSIKSPTTTEDPGLPPLQLI